MGLGLIDVQENVFSDNAKSAAQGFARDAFDALGRGVSRLFGEIDREQPYAGVGISDRGVTAPEGPPISPATPPESVPRRFVRPDTARRNPFDAPRQSVPDIRSPGGEGVSIFGTRVTGGVLLATAAATIFGVALILRR